MRSAEAGGVPPSLTALEATVRTAVAAVAATDPDPTDPFRGLYVSDDLALRLVDQAPGLGPGERLHEAATLLGLAPLDTAVLGLCAAPQLDPRYARLFAYLHDDLTRKLPSPRLVARLLTGDGGGAAAPPGLGTPAAADVLACFAHDAPLRTIGAVRFAEADHAVALADRGILIGDRLAAFLIGAELDEPAERPLRRVAVPSHDPGRSAQSERLMALLAVGASIPLVVAGSDADQLVAHAGGRPLVVADIGALADGPLLAEARLICALEGRRLCLEGIDDLPPERRGPIARGLGRTGGGVVLLARTPGATVALGDTTVLTIESPMPSYVERRAAWEHLTGNGDAGDVAAKFRLSVGQIAEAAEVARMAAQTRGAAAPEAADLDLGARQASSSRLGELATRLQPTQRWEHLVLPDRQREHLRSIAAHLRHRDRVMQEWGYEQTVKSGQGLKALFAGDSGTGKTMAAQVIAAELGLELYRVDLATVVSKYIGETEKNLDRIFDAAEGSNAILFFDEADALFGKRSEVSDAHDRYANIEVSYLLQKMEGYEGAVVMATNFQRNIDDAFLRRLDYVIDFPFPEDSDRRKIWDLLLPDRAPLAADVDLDFLSSRFKLAGGAIRNCALGAAYLAAAEGDEIAMRHLVRAVALEYGKLGRLTIEADFEQYTGELRTPTVEVPG